MLYQLEHNVMNIMRTSLLEVLPQGTINSQQLCSPTRNQEYLSRSQHKRHKTQSQACLCHLSQRSIDICATWKRIGVFPDSSSITDLQGTLMPVCQSQYRCQQLQGKRSTQKRIHLSLPGDFSLCTEKAAAIVLLVVSKLLQPLRNAASQKHNLWQ